MSDKDLLRIYLRDHHAAAIAGAELAKRSSKSNQGTSFEPALEELRADIEMDMKSLEDIMDRLSVPPAKGKDGVMWVAEKMGRLKLNGTLTGYSPLSRVVEFEGLLIGVTGKRSLWQSLVEIGDPRLDETELRSLIARADEQMDRIQKVRQDAVRAALT